MKRRVYSGHGSPKRNRIWVKFVEADAFTVMLRLSNEQFDRFYKDVQEDTKKNIITLPNMPELKKL